MKFSVLLILILTVYNQVNAVDDSLVAVHLVFRHGNRCPERSNLYKSSVYYNESYFQPFGFGQLTNKGKLTVYNLGKEIRQMYSGFLDESYSIDLIDARSSDFNRTKASLQTMLAGLFPPTKELTWLPGLDWQPIPYTYLGRNSDKELFCFGCQTWDSTIDKYLATKEGMAIFKKYDPLLEYLTNKTEEKYDTILKAYYLYFGFEILEEFNYTLPDWSKSVYPYPLKNLTMDYYDMISATTTLRQMSGGYLLKNILDDTQEKIDGKTPKKKMFIWSGHENNIAAILRLMKVWNTDATPKYGSYVALEVHFINGTYGFKVLYKNNDAGPVLLRLPGCNNFCPVETFKHLVKPDIPDNDSVCRGARDYNGAQEDIAKVGISPVLDSKEDPDKTFTLYIPITISKGPEHRVRI